MANIESGLFQRGKKKNERNRKTINWNVSHCKIEELSFFTFSLLGHPAGGPAAVRCLVATGAAMTTKTSAGGPSAPASLLCFTKDPPGSSDGNCCLPRPGDYRLQSRAAQLVRCGVGGCLGHHFDQTSCDISVCHIGEMDWVILLPDGNASRAD